MDKEGDKGTRLSWSASRVFVVKEQARQAHGRRRCWVEERRKEIYPELNPPFIIVPRPRSRFGPVFHIALFTEV